MTEEDENRRSDEEEDENRRSDEEDDENRASDVEEDENRTSDDEEDENRRSDDEKSQYIHFANVQQCNVFIHYIEKLNYTVGITCCGGLGCEILNIDNSTSHRIKKEFLASVSINNES